MKTATIALGGNAILEKGQMGTYEEQMDNIRKSVTFFIQLLKEGYEIVITHGNGPQVGNLLLQFESAQTMVPNQPVYVANAMTQGQLGYMIQQVLSNAIRKEKLDLEVVSLVTQVVVDPDDPDFQDPTKPVGPYFRREDIEVLKKKGWIMKEDRFKGGWRRNVPSPIPRSIVEAPSIRKLIEGDNRYLVIACGGGGIPVVETGDGFQGIEAVIDKDLATAVLATEISEDLFIILTDIDCIHVDHGTTNERELREVTLAELKKYRDQGQFPKGNMGPKVDAVIQFLENGGKRALVTSIERGIDALDGRTGTLVTP